MNWRDCSANKKVGGLGILDPNEALEALFAKWVVKALLPRHSNLQILLRFKLSGAKSLDNG